ncbi:MAG TPA: hypothetical protein VMU49_06515 [Candidatus Acidoferrales bacterium]|nr:hypothetical protein [Candidatus Acidoferrales bacterium]
MGDSTDDIEQELNATRANAEEKVLVLRRRTRRRAQQLARVGLVVSAAGLAVGAVAVAVTVRRRVSRRTGLTERLSSPLRNGLLAATKRVADRRGRHRPTRPIEPSGPGLKMGLRFSESLGTALGSAIAANVIRRLISGRARGSLDAESTRAESSEPRQWRKEKG